MKVPIKTNETLVKAAHLVKTYSAGKNTYTALHDVSFDLKAGDCVGYLGPNGAGKSTTIKLLTGIIQPTSGGITVFGAEPFANRKKLAYKIGVMFGNRSSLWPELTLFDTLQLLAKVYKMTPQSFALRTEYLVNELQLEPILRKPVRTLSLGQRMLAEIATTLIHSPELLLLDEPTIGLDVIVKERIGKFLARINKTDKVTILLASHDLVEVTKLCDQIIVIDAGKVRFQGGLDEISAMVEYNQTLKITHTPSAAVMEYAGLTLMENTPESKTYLIHTRRVSLNEAIGLLNHSYNICSLDIDKPGLSEMMADFITKTVS